MSYLSNSNERIFSETSYGCSIDTNDLNHGIENANSKNCPRFADNYNKNSEICYQKEHFAKNEYDLCYQQPNQYSSQQFSNQPTEKSHDS